MVTEWVEKTSPVGGRLDSAVPVAAPKQRRVRLVETDGTSVEGGECSARVVIQVGARRYAGTERGPAAFNGQIACAAKATLSALRQAIPGIPHLELKKVETFDAFDSLGVIVAVRMTEGDQQTTLVGVCPSSGDDLVRAGAIAVLNATNRRLGTG